MKLRLVSVLLFTALTGVAEATAWKKLTLSEQFFSEGGTFGDLNRDGVPDVISGPYWYEGPAFSRRHELYAPTPFDPMKYSDNFFAFVEDFNTDGWNDVLIIGFPGKDASWLENPGATGGVWKRHTIFAPVDNESPTYGDLFGNGKPVLICMSGGYLGYATRDQAKADAPWTFHAVTPKKTWGTFTHGLGFGDVNGDGRVDLLEGDGWWEQPASLAGDPVWQHHPAAFGRGAQILVTDVNGDGRADVISSLHAHGYGLAWFEQLPPQNGETSFRQHDLLSREGAQKINGVQFSQLHALALADVDGDGLPDIVTGKRRWAHGTDRDPEPTAAPVIYAFLLRRGAGGAISYEPRLIDNASGVGTQVVVRDLNGDGRADILSTNKSGTAVLLSRP